MADFMTEWPRFRDNIDTVCGWKIQHRPNQLAPVSGMLERLMRRLRDRSTTDAFEAVVNDPNLSQVDREIIALLADEMAFFSAKVDRLAKMPAQPPDVDEVDDAADTGETVKGSIEDVLDKLPGWLKKLLKILNEILKLIRPV